MNLRRGLSLGALLCAGLALWLARGGATEETGASVVPASEIEVERSPPPELVTAEAVASPPGPSSPSSPGEPSSRAPREAHRSVVPTEPVRVSPTRARLVDEATGEPIPGALVVTAERSSTTDALGWFDTGESLDVLDELQVLNVARNGSVKEVPREKWTRLADGWRVPLAIGPTYRLRLVGLERPSTGEWEGRLMRRPKDNDRWMKLETGPLLILRYDAPISELGDGIAPWIEARSMDGLQEGRGKVRSLVGVQEVVVDCRERAVLRGRVIDADGAPCPALAIQATQLHANGTENLRATTGKDGSYQLSASEPGTLSLYVVALLETKLPALHLPLPRGLTRAPDVVLASRPAGKIRGIVRCRSSSGPVDAIVRLRALDGSRYEQELSLGLGWRTLAIQILVRKGQEDEEREERGAITSAEFTFEKVPAGAFELSVSTKQGYLCSPAAIEVRAPAQGLVFTCDDRLGSRSHRLRVVDAESLSALDPLSLVRLDGAGLVVQPQKTKDEAVLDLADGVGFEWWVTAAGHRMARLTARDFQTDGDTLVATCALPRGFGARLRLQESSGAVGIVGAVRPWNNTRWDPRELAGVEVLADGVLVTTSDELGIAELDLPTEPERIELRLPGWRVVDSYGFAGGRPRIRPEADVSMVRE